MEDAAVLNRRRLARSARSRAAALQSRDHILPLEHLPKDDMFAVEVGRLIERDEELRAVGVGARVGHGELVGLGVLDREALVLELRPVDRLTSSAVSHGEIAALRHEARNHAMELAALVAQRDATSRRSSGARRQRREIFGRLGHRVAIQAENDTAGVMAIDFKVEVDALGDGLVGHRWRDVLLVAASTTTVSRGEGWHHWISLALFQAVKHCIEVEGIIDKIEFVVDVRAGEWVRHVPPLLSTTANSGSVALLMLLLVVIDAVGVLGGGGRVDRVLVAVGVVRLRAVGSLGVALSARASR